MLSRTPWNYALMIGGYRPALFPTLLIIAGLAAVIYQFVRRPSPDQFFLLGISAAVLVALIFMTLRVSSYAQVKAFYGFCVVVPLCAFAASGWNLLRRTPRLLQFVLGALFVFWALNSYCSTWILSSAAQHINSGRRYLTDQNFSAARAEAEKAIKSEPTSAMAQCFLAAVVYDTGDTDAAREQTDLALQLDPTNAECQLQTAINSGKHGELNDALLIAQRLIKSQPENAHAWNIAFSCALGLQRAAQAVEIGQDALAVSPFDADLHYRVGLAAGQNGNLSMAATQFAYAMLLDPKKAEPEQKLRVALSFLERTPNGSDAIRNLQSLATGSPKLLEILATYRQNLNPPTQDRP